MCYAHAKAYFEANGDLRVPANYKVDGIWLNKWLDEQQQIYFGRRKGKTLTPAQIEALERIGMTWRKRQPPPRLYKAPEEGGK